MDWKRKRWPAFVTLIVGMAFVIGSFSLATMGQLSLIDDDFEAYRHWPGEPPEVPDCTGYPNQEAAETEGWIFGVPWKLVDECELYGMLLDYPSLFPFATTIQAAYVGFVDPNTGTASYDGIEVSDPVLWTPFLELDVECQFIQASFDYWRQVEFYGDLPELDEDQVEPDEGDKNFDQTWVVVTFYSEQTESAVVGEPVTIWYKDSAWPSLAEWISAGPFSVPIDPQTASYVRMSFHFEAVDNYENEYVGWFVDNVDLSCYDNPPQICWDDDTPLNLKQGEVGEKNGESWDPYEVNFRDYMTEYGSDREIRFFLAKEGSGGCDCGFGDCVKLTDRDPYPLPERMTLTADGMLYASTLTEDMIGNYTFWVMVEGEGDRGNNCACHEFHLAIRSADETGYNENFPSAQDEWDLCGPGTPPDENLWAEVTAVYPETTPFTVLPDAEYGTVAYFGFPEENPPENNAIGGTYSNGERVKGCYCVDLVAEGTFCCLESYEGYEVEIAFKHFRQVEYYMGGAYDKTYVQVCTDTRDVVDDEDLKWETVASLSWDSRDASTLVWKWEQERTGIYIPVIDHEENPDDVHRLRVRFCFDSIDGYGNEYFGWAVDEVRVWLREATFEITACPLPAGYVGEPYSHELTYTGGSAGNRMYAEGLPEGLEVVKEGDAYYIKGTPRRTGVYEVTLGMEEYGTRICTLEILEQRCFFHEDFEDDPIWIWGAMWRRVGPDGEAFNEEEPCPIDELEPDLASNHVAAYNYNPDGGTTNYWTNPPARTTGLLSLIDEPAGLDVVGAQYIELTFDSCREVEQFSAGYDQTKVQVRFDTATTWHTVWYKDSADTNSTEWEREEANHGIPFEVPENAKKMWVRFVFDSVDKWYNSYFGWMIDNIQICFADEGGPIADEESYYGPSSMGIRRDTGGLSVTNFPNPVEDVHTTTFTVRGEGVEAIRIQIFDQNETLVFEQQIEGQELEWHTDNNYGEYLANGTYFYRAYALVDGDWIPTQFQKVVILR